MPYETPIYGLEAHQYGEQYSASVDRRRFTIIDNELGFLADNVVGSGRILGWRVSVEDEIARELKITPGMGMIDRFAVYTYGSYFVNVGSGRTTYVYMRRKKDVIGGFSGFSQMKSLIFVDNTPPTIPTITSVIADYNQNTISWSASPEPDLAYYRIYAATDNINFELITTTTQTTFIHDELTQDQNYYYKVSAVDLSGNESSTNAGYLSKTLKDLRQPIAVSNLQSFVMDTAIQLYWSASPSSGLDRYDVVIQPLDANLQPDGLPTTRSILSTKTFAVITGLTNGVAYKFTVYAMSVNNVASSPIYVLGIPAYNNGPGEVTDVDITYAPTSGGDVTVVMTLCVTPNTDPYLTPVDNYLITFYEAGNIKSNPIVVPKGDTCRDIRIVPYTDPATGQISYRSFKERIPYYVLVQGVSADGHVNNGVVVLTTVPSFIIPPPPTSFFVKQNNDRSLYLSWVNSSSAAFANSLLTIKVKDLDTNIETTSVIDVAKASTYVVPAATVKTNTQYVFNLQAFDSYGNASGIATANITLNSPTAETIPTPPTGIRIFAGDRQATIQWDSQDTNFIKSYSIWRGNFTFFPSSSTFTRIDTIPSTNTKYIDYNVENGNRYIYLVTSINVFDQESPNPEGGDVAAYTFVYATPIESSSISPPDNLQISQSGNDVILTWDVSAGSFDGFEIWRSIGNMYSFQQVADVSAGQTTYTDIGVLLTSSVPYYYMVRKFRNEAEPFLTESQAFAQGAVLLAAVTASDITVTVNEEPAVELLNLEDPVREATRAAINVHKHDIDLTTGVDRRVSLLSDVKIESSSWVTEDYQHYSTEEDLGSANSYDLRLEGDINREFFRLPGSTSGSVQYNQAAINLLSNGIPPFLYDIIPSRREISFQFPLYSTYGAPAPFQSEPKVTLTLRGISEVQGTLTNNRIGNFSASQVTTGIINRLQLPPIGHDGRMNEPLVPVQVQLKSDDQFIWSFATQNQTFDDALTFYDVIGVDDDFLIAATSRGILKSNDFGGSWTTVAKFPFAPFRLFYSVGLQKYFALTNQGVYTSTGDLTAWAIVSGTETVKVIRDMVEDGDGNIYISTDLGVYKMTASTLSQFFSFEQTTLFGPRSTESYAMYYDVTGNRVLVSNELGLLQTVNQGLTWTFTTEFDEFKKIHCLLSSNGYLFALTDGEIYRKDGSTFVKIAELDGKPLCRRMAVFDHRIWITSENGVYSTKVGDDIYTLNSLPLIKVFPEINVNNVEVTATSMNIVQDFLFVGTDNRLFVRKDNKTWLVFEDIHGSVPSVYVNGRLQCIGIYYNTYTFNFSFDDKLSESDTVSAAIRYDQYQAQHGGWVFQKYDARVQFFVNDILMADTKDLTDPIAVEESQFTGFQFPTYDESNSYLQGADNYKTIAQDLIKKLPDILIDGKTNIPSYISSIYGALERFNSQLFEEARVINVQDDSGNIVSTPLEFPPIFVTIATGTTYNVENGIFTFTKQYGKYDSLRINILGTAVKGVGELSHKEIEDAMELVNSGLPASLSQVEQANVVKVGIFNQLHWKDEQQLYATPFQAQYFVPYDNSWYDVLNSTVDWLNIVENDEVNPALSHATAVIYLSDVNKVLVGSTNGAYLIDNTTFDMKYVPIDSADNIEVKSFYLNEDVLYAVAQHNIYASEDNAQTWHRVDRTGLPNRLFAIAAIRHTLVVGAEDGVYYQIGPEEGWAKALDSTIPVEILYSPDALFAVLGQQVYFTADGANWVQSGSEQSVQFNAIQKHKNMMYVGTDAGLKKDDGTFYGGGVQLSLVDLLNDTSLSDDLVINDLSSDTVTLAVGTSDGTVFILGSEPLVTLTNLPLKTIHKILNVDGQLWLFGYDLFMVYDIVAGWITEHPLRLSTGAPL